ncbi:MAG: carboxypeptidase-like regulatory domain-containing protein [Methanosarcina sp.]
MDTIISLNNILKTPRSTIAERKKATERLAVLFKMSDDSLELMDYAVGSMKDEQVDFYNAYKMARKTVDSKTGNIALKGLALDLATQAPLKGVKFTFSIDGGILQASGSNGKITKTTALKGSFQIRNMQPGTYKVLVNKPGYKAKEVLVSISGGERSDLKVELEKA